MPDQKISVLHFIGDLDYAGAQEVVHTLVKYLSSNECRPIVCSLRDGPLRRDIESLGITVKVLGPRRYRVTRFLKFFADLRHIRRELINLIEIYDIDVIQTHLVGFLDFLVLTLLHETRLRVVLWTIHNVNFLPQHSHCFMNSKKFARRLLYRLAARRVSGFVAVSEEVERSIVRKLGPIEDKVFTISNGVDITQFEKDEDRTQVTQMLGFESDVFLAVVVGRFHVQKGHSYLVEATPTISEQYPQVKFLFIGEGQLEKDLKSQVNRLKLNENIYFLGTRSDVPAILAAVDLFVLPSLWEGLSIALLEAMAAGKPIVATAVSGTSEVMIPGKTGLLVPPGNSRLLAEAILRILAEPALARKMGCAAKQHVTENFSARKQADEHLALYRRLLQ